MTLAIPSSFSELRKSLSGITSTLTRDRIREQIDAIEQLRQRIPHSIALEREAIERDGTTWKFNCIQFALNLVPTPNTVELIASTYGEVFPSPEFMQYLIGSVLRPWDVPELDGALAVYVSEGKVVHAGKCEGDMIVSKWGTVHTWRHPPFEVPINYGERIDFYEPLSATTAEMEFLEWSAVRLGKERFALLFERPA